MLDEKTIQLRLDSLETKILNQVRHMFSNGKASTTNYDDSELTSKIQGLKLNLADCKHDIDNLKQDKKLENRVIALESGFSNVDLTPVNADLTIVKRDIQKMKDDYDAQTKLLEGDLKGLKVELEELKVLLNGFDKNNLIASHSVSLTNRINAIEGKINVPPTGILGGILGGNK